MRLNAYLARSGVASRRRADELIKAGRVRVNGAPGELNTVVGKRDVVEVDGQRVRPQKLAYVLLHKPPGVVTTARDHQGDRSGLIKNWLPFTAPRMSSSSRHSRTSPLASRS